MTTSRDLPEYAALLEYLKTTRGFDFTGYKRASLQRRIQRRMQVVGISTYQDYIAQLETREDEFVQLINTILINVTAFFRDEEPWRVMMNEVIPRIIEEKDRDSPIRVWSAGCATGEEAYSLAMAFTEKLGPDRFRERVKIYATDADEQALAFARMGVYSERSVANINEEWREKYFERTESRYTFRRELRRSIIFGRNDLTKDVPISKLDLLVCRNTLMYFDAPTQGRILSRFHFALNETGALFLGRAETLLTRTASFTPLDLKQRIFVKVPRRRSHDTVVPIPSKPVRRDLSLTAEHNRFREMGFDVLPIAYLTVDRSGVVSIISERARTLFRLTQSDIGRPFQDLEVSYRPVELRSCIEQAYSERRPVSVKGLEWRTPTGEARWFDLQIVPFSDGLEALGVTISYTDITTSRQLQVELEHSQQELVAAYEELQSTNEELETTNEELQSTVEELETTNEELQSTNEELETMNEELQSTNEELQTLNDDSNHRHEEVAELNRFLESIFTSLRAGVTVLDRELRILVWNTKAEDLWGLRNDEVIGEHFFNLDIGLPTEMLKQPIRATLADLIESQDVVIPAINRRGKGITCKVTCIPLMAKGETVAQGVILLMEETQGESRSDNS